MGLENTILRWKSKSQLLPNTFEKAEQLQYTDLILVSDDLIPFKVHKFVLGANSLVLEEILCNNPHDRPVI